MVAKPFEVRHTGSELKQLADYLKSLDGETRVVMEHTGRYYEQIAQYLHDEGIYVSAVNPKIIKDYGTGNTLRHVKTDKADAKKIAKFGIDRWAELREYTPMDTIRYQLKTLNRQCALYTKTKTMMKNNLIALLDQTYPGVNALFDSQVRKDGHQKWVDFAASFWHIDCVRSMSQTAFSERYRKWCKRHGCNFSSGKAVKIYGMTQDKIAMMPKDALTKLLVKQAVDALNAVSATLERLKAEALELASQLPEFPGEPRKDCVKANKRHPFSQELGQKNNLIERMYYYGKDTEGNAEGVRGQPEVQQYHRDHGCDEGDVPGCAAAGDGERTGHRAGVRKKSEDVGNGCRK